MTGIMQALLGGETKAPAGSNTYTTPGITSFTGPFGVRSLTVSVYGAGGGGGSGWFCGDAWTGGTGGTGGYLENQTLTVTPGEILSVTVGAAGADGLTSPPKKPLTLEDIVGLPSFAGDPPAIPRSLSEKS